MLRNLEFIPEDFICVELDVVYHPIKTFVILCFTVDVFELTIFKISSIQEKICEKYRATTDFSTLVRIFSLQTFLFGEIVIGGFVCF